VVGHGARRLDDVADSQCIGVWTTTAILYRAALQTDFDEAARQAARSTGSASTDEQLEALLPMTAVA